MSNGVMLDQNGATDVLSTHGADQAHSLAASLIKAGYAVVAVTDPALEYELDRAGLDTTLPPASPEQAAREDRWFAPERSS